ncbi:ribosome biogenesis protein BRX1 [Xylaria bambusicola]|uniref:ribosome biogenesis protein BRX1 n=1 Tax=Xylaria bambusicola TaxID=326684 RepID=UPI002008709F|nr:ribosome biogenesis protein BRX1 [Xylaria bambusicola]KAI0518550.1 ribosome biogenesis protein BRX1 [Xylaria bambusicola]
MAAVYKALSKSAAKDDASANDGGGVKPRNKQRVLMLTSRGVTYRHRHLLKDLASMMPHGRVDAKYDQKKKLGELNELAELYNCNNICFFEARKGQDLYLWLSKAPNGPTCKFLVSNIHTMEELAFSGNCLKGSRPILSFDKTFDTEPHLQVIKQLFLQIMGVPPLQKRSKPFIDHVMSFSVADGRIFLRVYQVQETEPTKKDGAEGEEASEESKKKKSKHADKGKELDISLLEIGPRCVLQPIIIQEGSFGGALLYENKHFVSPNQVRADLRRKGAAKSNSRAEQNINRQSKMGDLGLRTDGDQKPVDQLDSRELFA